MGSGLSGFLSGFLQTHLALQEHDDRRQREQAKLDLLKQKLALHRDVLRGKAAHLRLQDQLHQGRLELLLRRYGRQLAGSGPLPLGAAPPGAPGPGEGPPVPALAPPPGEVPPLPPLNAFTPQQLLEASDEALAGVSSPGEVPGLSIAQQQALALRFARRQPALPRR